MRFSTWAPFPIALLVVVAAMAGIFSPAIYARETASWAAQGVGQDWVDLVVAGPGLAIAGLFALGGDRRARLVVGGLLLYTAYSFAIYAVAVHFNPLFLVYCAVLGGSTFALVDLIAALRLDAPGTWFEGRAPIHVAGRTLYGIGAVFGLLWLAQIVPALVQGRDPAGLAEVGLVANPVHVLDLALLLPAMIVVGHGVQHGRPGATILAPILLAFAVVMAIAIGGMVLEMYLRGLALDLVPSVMMAIIAVAAAAVLVALLRRISPRAAFGSDARSPAPRRW